MRFERTCTAIDFRGWVDGRVALGRDCDGRPACGHYTPELRRAYLTEVADHQKLRPLRYSGRRDYLAR